MWLIYALTFVLVPTGTFPFRILMVPYASGFNSRLLNMQKMADILGEDGHDVSVLMNTKTKAHWIALNSSMIEYKTPSDILDIGEIQLDASVLGFFDLIRQCIELEKAYVHSLVTDKETLDKIKKKKFDLVIVDTISWVGLVLAAHLNTETILYQNFLMPIDPGVFYPIFPSFQCIMPGVSCRSVTFGFSDRLVNFFFLLWGAYAMPKLFINALVDSLNRENFALQTPLWEVTKNKITIINAHYLLEQPFPTMPHVFLIPGLFHKDPSPLKEEFLSILEESKPHGVVVVSFGSVLSVDEERAEMLTRVLGSLKQQVIWKYSGNPPKSLKQNTHIVSWLPQTDLLAHPLTRLFITHCGISSTFESVQNGVPVVAIPVIVDQLYNAAKLTERLQMGIRLDYDQLTEQDLSHGISEVLSNPMYAENARKWSAVLNNYAVPPKVQLRHLVNMTIITGGAPFLFNEKALNMNFIQFHSLDVIFTLLAVLIFMITSLVAGIYLLCRCCFMILCNKPKQKTL